MITKYVWNPLHISRNVAQCLTIIVIFAVIFTEKLSPREIREKDFIANLPSRVVSRTSFIANGRKKSRKSTTLNPRRTSDATSKCEFAGRFTCHQHRKCTGKAKRLICDAQRPPTSHKSASSFTRCDAAVLTILWYRKVSIFSRRYLGDDQ